MAKLVSMNIQRDVFTLFVSNRSVFLKLLVHRILAHLTA